VSSYAARRCRIHPAREAAARCPECARFYCRECVSEHDDRLLCRECLARHAAPATAGTGLWRPLARGALALAGLLAAWAACGLYGRFLLKFEPATHDSGLHAPPERAP